MTYQEQIITTDSVGWILLEVAKYFVAALVALGGREIIIRTWFKQRENADVHKTEAETTKIAKSAESSTLTISDQLLRQWMQDASNASLEISKLRKDLATAQICVDDMSELLLKSIKLMKQFGIDRNYMEEFTNFEAQVREALNKEITHA